MVVNRITTMGGRAGGGAGSGRGGGGAIRTPQQAAAAVKSVQQAGRDLEKAKKAAVQAQWAYHFGGDHSPKMTAKKAKAEAAYLKQQKAYDKLKASTSKKLKAYGGDIDLPF